MKIQIVCLLLVLLSAAVLSQDARIRHQYKKFQNQHVIERMSVDRCDQVMKARNIAKTKNKCKPINTFILSNIRTVKSICVDDGEPYGNMTKSRQRFNIVVCKLQNLKRKPVKCSYHGKELNKKIIIKCEEGFPVHYDGDIGHCEN